jgi:hypothetical protein
LLKKLEYENLEREKLESVLRDMKQALKEHKQANVTLAKEIFALQKELCDVSRVICTK